MLAFDISNYTGYLSDSIVQAWISSFGVERVIIACQFPEYYNQQMELCTKHGLEIQAYRYLYNNVVNQGSYLDQLNNALKVIDGSPYTRLYADVEDTSADLAPTQISEELVNMLPAFYGVKGGIYTGAWYWNEYTNSLDSLGSKLPLWLADWSGGTTIEDVGFGGWSRPIGRQYKAGVSAGGVLVNLSTFDE